VKSFKSYEVYIAVDRSDQRFEQNKKMQAYKYN